MHLDADPSVTIDKRPDGKFTFTVKYLGVDGPTSRPMESREDVELLAQTLGAHQTLSRPVACTGGDLSNGFILK